MMGAGILVECAQIPVFQLLSFAPGKSTCVCLVLFPSHVPDISLSFSKYTAQRMSFWQTPQVLSWVRATLEAIPSSRPALGWWEWNPNITSPSQWSTSSVRSSMMSLRSLMVSRILYHSLLQTCFRTQGVYATTSSLVLSRGRFCIMSSLPQQPQYHKSWWAVWPKQQGCLYCSLDLLQDPFLI